MIILVSLCVTRETAGFTVFLALESIVMLGFWCYMLAFLIMDNHRASASLVAIAIFANYILNYQWYEFYNDKLIKNDQLFQQYCNKFPKSARTIKIFSLLTSF